MRGAQLFEMVEKRGQPFYLIELKLYLISKSIAKALDLREERAAREAYVAERKQREARAPRPARSASRPEREAY